MTLDDTGDSGDAGALDGPEAEVPAYTANGPARPSADELRARIPGWGVDLDPADRPSYPKLDPRPGLTGAHWSFPERQVEVQPRERSIEHRFLTPVFGTAQPMRGLSGRMRKLAYARWSEARNAHWLTLIAADRVDVVEGALLGLVRGRPDNVLAQTGVSSELTHHGVSSRLGQTRADWKHQLVDPVVVLGPWVLAGWGVVAAVRRVLR
jgi:hypothetical protein